MTVKELLLQELEGTTDSLLLAEVLNYFRYLKFRQRETVIGEKNVMALISEPALAEDWLRTEEDEAWSHL